MTKYYCDKCGEEITDLSKMKRLQINCYSLIGRPIVKIMHYDCAVDYIGKEIVEEQKRKKEERQRKKEERQKELEVRRNHNATTNRKDD